MRKAWLFLALLCVVLPSASFAADPYIGYIYPSGIQAGTTNRFLIGGQNLWRLRGVHFDNSNLRVLDITQVPLFAPPTVLQKKHLTAWLDGIAKGIKEEPKKPDDPNMSEWRSNSWWRILGALDPLKISIVERNLFIPRNALQNAPSLRQLCIVTVAADATARPGIYQAMAWSEAGISAPRPFAVTAAEHTAEPLYCPPHRKKPETQVVDATIESVVLDGQIMPGETDSFKLRLSGGLRYSVKVKAREFQPYVGDAVPGFFNPIVTIKDSSNCVAAVCDDTARFRPDPSFDFKPNFSDVYTLEIHDVLYRGRADFVYSIEIEPCRTDIPNERNALRFSGTVSKMGGKEVREFSIDEPGRRVFEIIARRDTSPLDAVLTLLEMPERKILARWDDTTNRVFVGTVPQGECDPKGEYDFKKKGSYAVEISDRTGHGGDDYFWKLEVRPPKPDFEVYSARSTLPLSMNRPLKVDFAIVRKEGFAGNVTLEFPDGVKATGNVATSGVDRITATLTYIGKNALELSAVKLGALGKIDGKVVRREVVPCDEYEQAFAWKHLVPAKSFVMRATPGKVQPKKSQMRVKPASRGIAKSEYLDFMEAAVRAYADERLHSYCAEADRDGVQEHGFPRLAANMAILVANGRLPEKRELAKKMMDVACRDAKKGKMPPKSGGNEFSVKELSIALVELEKRGTFPTNITEVWRRDLKAVDPIRCYNQGKIPTDLEKARNWVVFGCASEQARIRRGLGGNADFVEKYVADQLRWFDSNGMYRDPHQPMVYDLVTRLQFAQILDDGFSGPSRKKLERFMVLSAEPTLKMLSACGEIPYGGRSNQFLHNNTFYSALCEWYAVRFARNGDMAMASKFRRAAAESANAMRVWLAENPVSHVKNRYFRESGKGVYSENADIGCERYAYFDKYMITMGSWAMLGWHFCNDTIPASQYAPAKPDVFLLSPTFHLALMNAGEYSAQFDYCANDQYDCNGLGRFHRRGAPAQLCLSTPCAKNPNYRIPEPNPCAMAIRPIVDEDSRWCILHDAKTSEYALTKWKVGNLDWECRLSKSGMEMALLGQGKVSMELPVFEFDGRESTSISYDGKSISVSYRGWTCLYLTDGKIERTDKVAHNRNGRYAAFEAIGVDKLKVWIDIRPK